MRNKVKKQRLYLIRYVNVFNTQYLREMKCRDTTFTACIQVPDNAERLKFKKAI